MVDFIFQIIFLAIVGFIIYKIYSKTNPAKGGGMVNTTAGPEKWQELTSQLKYVYFENATKSGIAIDTEQRLIHLASEKALKSYPLSDVRSWRHFEHNSMLRYMVFEVVVRDVDHPRWSIRFGIKDNGHERWMEILNQSVNES